MRFSTIALASLLLLSSSHCFTLTSPSSVKPSLLRLQDDNVNTATVSYNYHKTHLSSTLSPDASLYTANDDDDDDANKNKMNIKMNNNNNNNNERDGENKPNTDERLGAISMQLDELVTVLGGKGRAQIVWDCYSIGIDPAMFFGTINLGYDDFESIHAMLPSSRRTQKLGPEALSQLASTYSSQGTGDGHRKIDRLEGGVATLSYLSKSSDGTTKILLTLADQLQIETVIIPWWDSDKNNKEGKTTERSTLCVSSQVGCRQGCRFCATGKMGKLRSLTSDEILAQLFFAKKLCRLEGLPEITNIVFMGMGDAADNVENVVKATEIMTTRELFQLSASRVTVSTVGPSPDAFHQFAKAPCVIAWSVHAANDELRKQLVPTTKYSMNELRQGLIDALLSRPMNGRIAMLEVALMHGVNDSLQEAQELADFTK
eukprot:scaffold12976_cov141-Cylindrotheca_fusiformis.AAC.4